MALNGYNSRLSRTTSSQNGRPGVYHRGLNTLTKLSGSSGTRGAATTVTARNLPRPINTSSLKKENGGQDITAVLVNRDGGKKVGWGSSLPEKAPQPVSTASLEPTPADASALALEGKSKSVDTTEREPRVETKHPPLPPPPTESNKNVPWALHPPSQQSDAAARPRSPSPRHSDSEGPPYSENGYPDRLGDSDMSHRDGYPDSRGGSSRYARPDNRHEWNDGGHRYRDSNYYRRYPARNDNMGYGDRERYHGRGEYDRSEYYRGERSVNYSERDYRDRDYRSERGDYRDRSDNRYNDGPRHEYRNRDNFMSHRGGYNYDRGNDRYSNSNDRYSRERYYRGDDRRARDENYVHSRRESYDNENRDWRDSQRGRYSGDSSPLRNGQNYENDMRQNHGYPTNSSANDPVCRQTEYSDQSSNSQKNDDSSEVAAKDFPRGSNWMNRSYEPPQRSEDDIVLQTIRQREAADSRARSRKERVEEEKEKNNGDIRQEPAEDYGVEKNKQNPGFKPTVILRNNQTSGEASGSDTNTTSETKEQTFSSKSGEVEKSNAVFKEDELTSEISEDHSENSVNETKIEKSNVEASIEVSENSHLDSEQASVPVVNSILEGNIELSKEVADNTIDQQQKKNMNETISAQNYAEESESDYESERDSENELDEIQIQPKSRETLRFEQQQKILRQVEATRAKHSKKASDNEKATGIDQVKDKSKIEKIVEDKPEPASEPITREIKPKTKKLQPLPKKKGPRTRGVLFKRLSDGSLVNADLSEEELVKRAERKLRKKQSTPPHDADSRTGSNSKRIEEDQVVEETDNSDAIPHNKKEQNANLDVENAEQVAKNTADSSITKVQIKSTTNDLDQPLKEFIPSPGPKVSAWKAGPPPGMVKSQPKTQELPSKLIESNNSSKITDILSTRLVDVGKSGDEWVNSAENDKSAAPKYAAVAPIMNSSWNAFSGSAPIPSGTIGLFASTEQCSPAVSTDWSIPTHKSEAAQGVMQWRSTITQEVDEDDAAALTDGSDAVPRDLLSSGACSDNECEDEPETKDDKPPKSSKFRRPRKSPYTKNSKGNSSVNQNNDHFRKKKTFTRRSKPTYNKEETNDDIEDKPTHRNPSKRPTRKLRPEIKTEKVPKHEKNLKSEKTEKSETFRKGRNPSRPRGKFSRKRETGTDDIVTKMDTPPQVM